jgi:hypothetical protein
MSFMPSQAYIAQVLFNVGTDIEWDDASPEEKRANMAMARIVIAAIQSWQAQHRPNGQSDRYCFEMVSEDNKDAWAIYDRKLGLNTKLGVIHDVLLAQQIVDDLNKREPNKQALARAVRAGE